MTKVKRFSYIDLVVMQNTKKDYPLPGPGSHFHDATTLKKLPEEQRELIKYDRPKEKMKSKTS